MKKNILQDVIPPKKSIRNIELPSRSRKVQQKTSEPEVSEKIEKEPVVSRAKPVLKQTDEIRRPVKQETPAPAYKYDYDEPPRSSKKILYIAGGIFVLALLFGISALFKSAEIKITPKQEIKALNESFTARKDATTGLGFQLVTITKDVEETVEATTEEQVDKKATGRIVIYNNTNQSQKLVATTRFETADGLVFRLINAAVIPARTVKDGKTVAGSLEVQVAADKAGEKYNIGLTDFTIPGFKGDSKFTQVYARSKTTMSGGFSGIQKVVSKEVMNTAEGELEAELRASLSKDIFSQIPANFVLYESGITYSFDPVAQANGASGGAVIRKRGTANGIIFDKGTLSRAIMAETMPEASSEVVKIVDLDKLQFSLTAPSSFDPVASNSITFDLKGETNAVWVLDENKLKSDLLGLSEDSAKTVIGSYGNITDARIETRPFWSATIPQDPEKVKLINTLTK